MRADKAIMIGVVGLVGLGAYAVYRAFSAASASSPPPPRPLPPDVPIVLPNRAGALIMPPPGVLVTGPRDLHPQFWYMGRLDLFGTPGLTLPPAWLIGTIESSGFGGSNIRPDAPEAATLPRRPVVYSSPREAAAAGVPGWALADPGIGTRWFYARWTGNVPNTAVPSFVKIMWRAIPPTGGSF